MLIGRGTELMLSERSPFPAHHGPTLPTNEPSLQDAFGRLLLGASRHQGSTFALCPLLGVNCVVPTQTTCRNPTPTNTFDQNGKSCVGGRRTWGRRQCRGDALQVCALTLTTRAFDTEQRRLMRGLQRFRTFLRPAAPHATSSRFPGLMESCPCFQAQQWSMMQRGYNATEAQ